MSMSNTGSSTSSVFGERRNNLISRWKILFDDNPKEWIGFKPALGLFVYPCYACRHMFSSLTSLQDHVNRRVIVLKYNCSGCSNEIFTFYNRCSFLLHTRNHFDLNQGKINLREVDMFPLPISLAGFLPHPNIPFIYDSEEEIVEDSIYLNAQFYTSDPEDKGKEIIVLKPNDLIFKQNTEKLALKQLCRNIPKCVFITIEQQKLLRKQNMFVENNNNVTNGQNDLTIKEEGIEEYGQQMTMPIIAKVESLQETVFKLPHCLDCNTPQKCTMAEHYRGDNKPTDTKLSCPTCKFVASTQCSLKAHIRIHSASAPHVCPDCGKDFETWILLREHMDDVCFHSAKHVRFRCPGKRCSKLLATNISLATHFQVHLKCLYMCSICNAVFFHSEKAEEHREIHNEPCSFSKLYDCSLCSNIELLNSENYLEHINFHTTSTDRCMYVYMCKFCRSFFRSTATYATHLLKCSSKQNYSEIKFMKNYVQPKYITKDCENCHNKVIFNAEKPVNFCSKCKFMKPKVALTKKYYCVLCTKQIKVDEKISHMKVCKYSKPAVVIPKLTNEYAVNNSFESSDYETSSSPTKSPRKQSKMSGEDCNKKKRKRIYIPNYRNKKPEVKFDLTAEEPIKFDGTYYCKLCKNTTTNRADFHNHVKIHRDISTAYQCMECGECFVVKPSLVKHLMHFHNISDHESYLKDNDCYDLEAMKELEDVMHLAPGESKGPVKENQCRVCLQEFGDSITLNKHFRIHGMAFLLRNSK